MGGAGEQRGDEVSNQIACPTERLGVYSRLKSPEEFRVGI